MYARTTKVDAAKSEMEIRALLSRNGASQFIIGGSSDLAMVMFEMRDWRIRFLLPLAGKKRLTEKQAKQETRRRWRALLLVIKAKLEAVESGIVEFEREFLPFIVTNGTTTVGDQVIANGGLAQLVSGGKLPPLLGPGDVAPSSRPPKKGGE